MHRAPNHPLRAVAAAALAAVMWHAPAAAADDKSTKPRIAVIEFKNQAGSAASPPLEILGWAWGDASAIELEPVFVKSWSTSGDAAPPRAGGSNQMSMDDTAGKEKSPSSFGEWIADVERPQSGSSPYRANDRLRNAGPKNGSAAAAGDPDRPIIAGSVPNASSASPGANETITIAGGRTETASGQATGKRQHMPIRTRQYYGQPRGKGSVWVRVATPWAACRVGARYPSLELAGRGQRYVLQDVTVANCGGSRDADDRPTEEVAFYYNKVTVRGWDPKKKEE